MTADHRSGMEGFIMSQTRSKPQKKKPATAPKSSLNGAVSPSTEVFTLSDAAAYLRVSEAELLSLVHDQALPGRRFGTEWRFLKSAIQEWLKTPPKPGSREAVLSTFGVWKDDPCVEEELKEIYRKRREDLVDDIQ
jgi:excisionase family DNA binding protein